MRIAHAVSASVVAASLLGGGVALGQPAQSDPCAAHEKARAHAPKQVAGRVVKVDPPSGTLVVETSDGTVHEFRASKELAATMKVGDRVEATLRPVC